MMLACLMSIGTEIGNEAHDIDANLLILGQEAQHVVIRLDHKEALESLQTVNSVNPAIRVEPLSDDPNSKEFLDFRIIKMEGNKEIVFFRASDIVKMRTFIASLGYEGKGLFSESSGATVIPVEAVRGHWDILHPSEDEVYEQLNMLTSQVKKLESHAEGKNHAELTASAPPATPVLFLQLAFTSHKTTPIIYMQDLHVLHHYLILMPRLLFLRSFEGHGMILFCLLGAHQSFCQSALGMVLRLVFRLECRNFGIPIKRGTFSLIM